MKNLFSVLVVVLFINISTATQINQTKESTSIQEAPCSSVAEYFANWAQSWGGDYWDTYWTSYRNCIALEFGVY